MQTIAYRLSAVLWVVWGLVHVLAGVIILTSDASGGFAAVADKVVAEDLAHAYHPAVGAILHQHGWNLAWIGLTTLTAAVWVWRGVAAAVFLAALVGGMADIGYFLFLDLGGFVHFIPGGFMTVVSGTAILTSVWAVWSARGAGRSV